jgi:hypothetical protein
MAKIKNVGRGTRRIVGTFMLPGEELELPDALAKKLIGDDDFVITWGEAVVSEVVIPEPVYESAPDLPFEIVEEPVKKVSKRGKKK